MNTVEDGTNGNGTFVICKCMQIGAVAAFRVDEIRTSKLEGTNSTNAPVATNAPNTTNANSGAKGTAKGMRVFKCIFSQHQLSPWLFTNIGWD